MSQNPETQTQTPADTELETETETNTDRIDYLIRAGLQQIQDREIRQDRATLAEIGIGI